MIPMGFGAFFSAVDDMFLFLEKLGPAINDWIELHIPAEKQRVIDRRIRKCKRICRRGNYNQGMINSRVALDFSDLEPTLQADISRLLIFELLKINIA